MSYDEIDSSIRSTSITWATIEYNIDDEKSDTRPCNRTKHSTVLVDDYIYVHGGRNGHIPLKDFWRYDLNKNKWEIIKPIGDCPPCLQEHSSFTHDGKIYMFGGELGFSNALETPLWIYDCQANSWRKFSCPSGMKVPKGRRGHSIVVTKKYAIMFGGYCDLVGSSNELWMFQFNTESWQLLSINKNNPSGRHKHSAVIHKGCMWIYGGLNDLQENSEIICFDIVAKTWFPPVRCKTNPGPRHSHTVVVTSESMIIFGGVKNGQPTSEVWAFHFKTESWQLVPLDITFPYRISEASMLNVGSKYVDSDDGLWDESSNFLCNDTNCNLLNGKCSHVNTYRLSRMETFYRNDAFINSVDNDNDVTLVQNGCLPKTKKSPDEYCLIADGKNAVSSSQNGVSRLKSRVSAMFNFDKSIGKYVKFNTLSENEKGRFRTNNHVLMDEFVKQKTDDGDDNDDDDDSGDICGNSDCLKVMLIGGKTVPSPVDTTNNNPIYMWKFIIKNHNYS